MESRLARLEGDLRERQRAQYIADAVKEKKKIQAEDPTGVFDRKKAKQKEERQAEREVARNERNDKREAVRAERNKKHEAARTERAKRKAEKEAAGTRIERKKDEYARKREALESGEGEIKLNAFEKAATMFSAEKRRQAIEDKGAKLHAKYARKEDQYYTRIQNRDARIERVANTKAAVVDTFKTGAENLKEGIQNRIMDAKAYAKVRFINPAKELGKNIKEGIKDVKDSAVAGYNGEEHESSTKLGKLAGKLTSSTPVQTTRNHIINAQAYAKVKMKQAQEFARKTGEVATTVGKGVKNGVTYVPKMIKKGVTAAGEAIEARREAMAKAESDAREAVKTKTQADKTAIKNASEDQLTLRQRHMREAQNAGHQGGHSRETKAKANEMIKKVAGSDSSVVRKVTRKRYENSSEDARRSAQQQEIAEHISTQTAKYENNAMADPTKITKQEGVQYREDLKEYKKEGSTLTKTSGAAPIVGGGVRKQEKMYRADEKVRQLESEIESLRRKRREDLASRHNSHSKKQKPRRK